MTASITAAAFGLAVMVWCGLLTADVAMRRGRPRAVWFWAGALLFILFPIPLLVVLVLPPRLAMRSAASS